ncbi:MAG: wax ester/triacylglycerol synthase family O-acyltransferase [Pseudomonadales bacterium]
MYKLAGLDAGFLYNETPRAPQHIASIQVLELPDGVGTAEFIADLKQLLLDRAHLVSYFTNKLQYVPFMLDHPVWVRDAAFDIDNHVLHAEVASPGGRAELEAKIAELHATPLDRSKPLWELWVLTGLEGGRIAYYNRVHHACLDGVSGQAAVAAIMDVTPEPRVVEQPPAAFAQRPDHRSGLDMLLGAFENFARFQLRQATGLLDQVETARRLWQRSVDPSKGFGALMESAPKTRFNHSVDRARSYATGELPLGDLKAIGKATGTSLNDVFLAVCSGALRAYLSRRGELPEASMVAGCPVSLRQPGDTSANNQVTMMMVSFASDESDPVKRLLRIGLSSAQAKGVVADAAGSFDSDVALPGLPGVMSAAMRLFEAADLAESLPRLPCNAVVSNVPGPRQQLYSLGARVLTHYPVSIPAHTQGMNITVQSYLDQMFFGITACAKALPDADVLRNDMLAAFVELKARVLKAPAAFPPRERARAVGERPLKPLGATAHRSEDAEAA